VSIIPPKTGCSALFPDTSDDPTEHQQTEGPEPYFKDIQELAVNDSLVADGHPGNLPRYLPWKGIKPPE
jgi:hypothetical protein